MMATPDPTSPDIHLLARQLKALAEPNRLRVIDLLATGVQCNCNLGDKLKMQPSLVSHHLRILRQAGLVSVQRSPFDARWLYYSLNATALERLLEALTAFLATDRVQVRDPACGPQEVKAPE